MSLRLLTARDPASSHFTVCTFREKELNND